MISKYFTVYLIISFILICNVFTNKIRRNYRESSQSINYEHGIQKFYSKIIVHKHIEESCNNQHKKKIRKSVKLARCQPMDTVVHLAAKNPSISIFPDKVVVKRCYETGCYGLNSCIANNTREVPVAVRFVSQSLNNKTSSECGVVNVIEHVQCTCGCKIIREECERSGKKYNGSNCSCRCPNENKRSSECTRQLGKEWDEDTCSCKCTSKIVNCPTGMEWVPKYCQCLKVLI